MRRAGKALSPALLKVAGSQASTSCIARPAAVHPKCSPFPGLRKRSKLPQISHRPPTRVTSDVRHDGFWGTMSEPTQFLPVLLASLHPLLPEQRKPQGTRQPSGCLSPEQLGSSPCPCPQLGQPVGGAAPNPCHLPVCLQRCLELLKGCVPAPQPGCNLPEGEGGATGFFSSSRTQSIRGCGRAPGRGRVSKLAPESRPVPNVSAVGF